MVAEASTRVPERCHAVRPAVARQMPNLYYARTRGLYDTKKRVIERVNYGADNQQRAIEIYKLRLWPKAGGTVPCDVTSYVLARGIQWQ